MTARSSRPAECPACAGARICARPAWLIRCPGCSLLGSTLEPAIGTRAHEAVDEEHRAAALKELRRANFERILDRLEVLGASGRLLDVGCAHGWFLEAATRRGFTCVGLEPDESIAAVARAAGLDVRSGLFPQAVPPAEVFDVVSFHDVLEHLPDPLLALRASREVLRPGGLLVVNLPSRAGLFYRLATALERLGAPGPLERLWQKGFPSPHLWYFEPHVLARLAARAGLVEVHRDELPSLRLRGLWSRVRLDRTTPLPKALLLAAGSLALLPATRVLPADITWQAFRSP